MRCKICGSKTTSFIDDELKNCLYHHCEECEFIFKDSSFYVNDKDELKQYQNHNNSFESTGYVKMFEDFISFCFSGVDLNGGEILEFGCGPGPVLAKLLENEGAKVTKYDKFFFDDGVIKKRSMILSPQLRFLSIYNIQKRVWLSLQGF